MSNITRLQQIKTLGIIAILRATSPESLLEAANALNNGGINVIEVTLTTPGALNTIELAKKHYICNV